MLEKDNTLTAIVGAVVIGRNEGSRLAQCLRSLLRDLSIIYYVDSGSSDNSVQLAHSLGVEVIELDTSKPFSAARARNEGWFKLAQQHQNISYVQFVDGDCEVVEGWISAACNTLSRVKDCAVVCGRRHERYPDATIFNKLCDIEWDTPAGDTNACGGDSTMRVEALKRVGGFNPNVVAGEEPELCVRIRANGWRVIRLDVDMTIHDAAMVSFAQWWKRANRTGHAFAEGAYLHGKSADRHWVRESCRVVLWGGVIPTLVIATAPLTSGWSFLLLLGYLGSTFRAYRSRRKRGSNSKDASLYGLFCTIGKFPEFVGMCRFYIRLLRNKRSTLIEYKNDFS